MVIREIKQNEIMLLTDFLYEAIFQRDTKNPIPRTVLQKPDIWIFIDGFGTKKDDHCLVCELEGIIVGAVWVRCINGFGHIDDTTPEFAISVYPEYRKMGIGKKLMSAMIEFLREKDYKACSLAVQKDNYAAKMYQSLGFSIVGENEEEFIMLYRLEN